MKLSLWRMYVSFRFQRIFIMTCLIALLEYGMFAVTNSVTEYSQSQTKLIKSVFCKVVSVFGYIHFHFSVDSLVVLIKMSVQDVWNSDDFLKHVRPFILRDDGWRPKSYEIVNLPSEFPVQLVFSYQGHHYFHQIAIYHLVNL